MADKQRKKFRVKKSAVPDLLDLDDDEIEVKARAKKEPKIASPGRRSRASPGKALAPAVTKTTASSTEKNKSSKSDTKLGKKTASKNTKTDSPTPKKAITPAVSNKKRKRESDVSVESPPHKKSRVTRESKDDTRPTSDVYVSIDPFYEDTARHVSDSDSDEGGETSYFDQRETTSSGHTLTGVKLLDSKEVHATVSQLRDTHCSEKEALVEGYHELFPQWWCQLRSGFNLLFYGLGSKKQLLEDFAKIYCKDNPLIVVNGYFPNLTVKAILNALVTKVLNVSDASVNAQFKSVHEQVEYLQHIWAKHEEIRSPRVKHRLHKNAKLYHDVPDRIYLLLHNIDAPALRTPRAQEHLSLLAHIPQLHLLASSDHLNAALLWDNRQLDRFNWLWLHVPSYARLKSETSYEGQISDQFAARRPGGRRGALQVLQTLPAKAKQIFLVLARSQLADPQSRGLEFEQYLAQCQEQFLTSTSTVFKATLGEFVDHQLIQMKRAADGALYCNTPLHLSTLKQILEEIDQEQ